MSLDLLLESLLPRYCINTQQQIEHGADGDVYAGHRNVDKIPVALKIVKVFTMCKCDTCHGRLPIELCMLLKCQGICNVIEVYDYVVKEDATYILMEKPEKCMDMWYLVQDRERLPFSTARHYFRQLTKAIYMMKQMGVVHGDLKGENVLVDLDKEDVKIIDFGSAHSTATTDWRQMVGTVYYRPPEAYISGSTYRWEPVTVWTLGFMLYDMVHGHDPFCNQREVMQKDLIVGGDVPPSLRDLLRKMLAKKAADRPSLEQILKQQWVVETSV